MQLKIIIVLALGLCLSCLSDKNKDAIGEWDNTIVIDSTFNRGRWLLKDKDQYAYRSLMYRDVVYNDTIRALNQRQILKLLGEPDKTENNHLYYTISQKKLGFWSLHTTTMVIKFSDSNTIEWIKIHE